MRPDGRPPSLACGTRIAQAREDIVTSALTNQARAALDSLGGADLLVGIPSYNNATTIGYVVQTAAEGLARHFPEQRGVVFNSDGGSTDGTPDAVRAVTVPDRVRSMSLPYVGPS